MGEWGDAFNYDHASKQSMLKAFKRLRSILKAYEDKCWIFSYINNETLKRLHEHISGVISKINAGEKYYGYYVYCRDMRKALDTLDVQINHGDKYAIAKAYGEVLYNAGMLIGTIPLLKIQAEGLKAIGSKFAEFVNKIGPTRGLSEYDEFFQ